MLVMKVFFARSLGRLLYCSYARCTCSSNVCTFGGSKPYSLNSLRSLEGKADPLLWYGDASKAVPWSRSVDAAHGEMSAIIWTAIRLYRQSAFFGSWCRQWKMPKFDMFGVFWMWGHLAIPNGTREVKGTEWLAAEANWVTTYVKRGMVKIL